MDGPVSDSTLESVPDSENSSVESFVEQDSPATSGVIDFLDEENDAPVSDEMIVIGEKRLSQENVAEPEEKKPEEKKPEESEPAATEPAVFKPAVSEPVESESATSELETKESEVPAQNEVESVVSDEENESTLTEETPIAEKVPSDEENSITEIPIEEEASSDEETPPSDEVTDKRHVVLPRYLVITASVVFLAMIGGFGWFAFNYGKLAAQRDHLALQLDNYQQIAAEKKAPAKSASTQEEILRKKAIEDSVRMAQASEAVKKVENAEQNMDATADKQSIDVKSAEAKKHAEAKKTEEARKQAEKHAAQASSKYDQDARVRTGAYRIIGVSEVVTAREGQTIKSLSQKYLGPGMECYVEALNGNSLLKPGQKVKIPKLELKKKK